MKKLSETIIAVDFDGTCVTHEYPNVGKFIGAEGVLKDLTDAGAKLILYTMRSDTFLGDAINWFRNRGIPLYGVNSNPDQLSWTSSPKVYAHIYIDDAALGAPLCYDEARPYINWEVVRNMLLPEPECKTA
jgi:hypothetical protein